MHTVFYKAKHVFDPYTCPGFLFIVGYLFFRYSRASIIDAKSPLLKNKGYDYMCVSRSSLKEYHADTTASPVEIKDKKDQPIELLKVKTCGDNDQYLWVRSQAKALKEKSMNGLLSQRFEEGIQNIQEGIAKKGGTKKLNKVYERVGRLKQKYP